VVPGVLWEVRGGVNVNALPGRGVRPGGVRIVDVRVFERSWVSISY
jgi:hypothetical protein